MDMNRRHLIGGSAAGVAGALAMSPDAARAAPLTSMLGRDVTHWLEVPTADAGTSIQGGNVNELPSD